MGIGFGKSEREKALAELSEILRKIPISPEQFPEKFRIIKKALTAYTNMLDKDLKDLERRKKRYELNVLTMGEEPVKESLMRKYKNKIPMLINVVKDGQQQIWIFGLDKEGEPNLSKLKNQEIYQSLNLPKQIPKDPLSIIHVKDIPEKVFKDLKTVHIHKKDKKRIAQIEKLIADNKHPKREASEFGYYVANLFMTEILNPAFKEASEKRLPIINAIIKENGKDLGAAVGRDERRKILSQPVRNNLEQFREILKRERELYQMQIDSLEPAFRSAKVDLNDSGVMKLLEGQIKEATDKLDSIDKALLSDEGIIEYEVRALSENQSMIERCEKIASEELQKRTSPPPSPTSPPTPQEHFQRPLPPDRPPPLTPAFQEIRGRSNAQIGSSPAIAPPAISVVKEADSGPKPGKKK